MNDTYETGPIHLTIQSLQVASLELEEEYKQQFNGRESLTMVTGRKYLRGSELIQAKVFW
ncbi:hypothetical protein [Gracilibacillus timonensis]|uniref:hypothetical protein n=1 Tax=Gracilibacillus timonensis TaxID=1816696 RepID=UPI000824A810|nr:hypothetical protein [Gracilibacillus timonensis]